MRLEFGEGHLDRVEIGAVGWREEEPCPTRLEDSLGLFAFVAGEIIENHDVVGIESGGELGFNISFKSRAVHGAVDDSRRGQAIAAQGGDKCLSFPMAKGSARLKALVTTRSSPQPCHLGRGCGLVNKDQPMRLFTQI